MAGNAIYHCSGHLEETACDESEWWKTNGEKDERMEQRNGQSVVMDKGKQILILRGRGAFGGGGWLPLCADKLHLMTDGKYGGIFQKLNSRSLQCNWQQPERRPQFLTPICRRSDKLAFGNFLENGGLGPKSGLVAITGIPGFWRSHNDLVCTAIKNNAVTRNKKPHTGSAILIISHSLLFYICGLQLLCL